MSRAEAAVERLYESASVRDELTDDEAEALLKWAEAELAHLDSAEVDDDAYAAKVDTLLDLLKQVNRFAGRQGQVSAQNADPSLAKIAELAGALGHTLQSDQVAAAATGDPAGTISTLTALISTPAADAASTSAPAEPPVQPPAAPSGDYTVDEQT